MEPEEIESETLGVPMGRVHTDKGRRTKLVVAGVFFAIAVAVVVAVLLGPGLNVASGILLGVTALLGVFVFVQVRSFNQWDNPQLFLPHNDPLNLGEHAIARYRRVAKRSGLTVGAQLSAQLVCEERATYQRGTDRVTVTHKVYDVPVRVVTYDHPKMVEADLHLDVPLFDAPPTMDLGDNEIRWRLRVEAKTEGADQKSTFPVIIAPALASEVVNPQ